MQPARKNKLQIKNICALIFCLSIIILGAICCGNASGVTTATSLPLLSSGQCKGNNVAPVAGEQTLAVVTQTGPNITICILRASDGVLLRHYDLALYGTILGSNDGLLYVNEYSDSSVLCAVQISDGLERWCQSQQNGINSIVVGNGNVYATSYSAHVGQTLITALSEHDGRVLWTASMLVGTNPTNQLLLTAGPGVLYSYQAISAASPTPTTSTNQTFASNPNGVCALRASDGRQLWCYPLVEQSVTGMVADENSLYVRDTGNYPSIYAFGAANGAVRWHTLINQAYPTGTSSLLTITNGILFTNVASSNTTSDQLYALQTSDGKQLWSTSQPEWIISVTATDKDVYAMANSGTLHVLNILNGKAAWSYKSFPENSPTYNNNNNTPNTIFVEHNVAYILIGTDNYTYLTAISANDGTALWQDQRCNNPVATPTASPGTTSSKGPIGRCYWGGHREPESIRLSLYEIND